MKPVQVGQIVNFEAKIGYVIGNIMQVAVNCSIVDTDKSKVKCNDLHITLVAPKRVNLQKVISNSYEEAMVYLESKRRLESLINWMEISWLNLNLYLYMWYVCVRNMTVYVIS